MPLSSFVNSNRDHRTMKLKTTLLENFPVIGLASAISLLTSSANAALNLGPDDIDVVAGLTTDANGNKVVDANATWTADKTYILTDKVFVTEGATLTIEPGTKIYSSLDDGGTSADSTDDFFGALIVTRGSMIDANGTSAAPIIFDSIDNLEALRGSDVDGDGNTATALGRQDAAKWGGVIILGNATVSRYDASGLVGEGQIEGFSTATNATNDLDNDGRVDLVEYGGGTSPVDNDDSGIFRYVSIRHGGRTFVTGSEINGLTLGGVGSDTEIDHVEVFANSDDGIEFFGGTVSTSHMVMAYNFDDGFDFDEGQSGEHQYWLVIQDHAPGATGADNGGEWDGTGGTKAVTNILSTPKLFNLTFVGPGTNGGTALGNDKGNNAMLMDDFFNGQIYNSVFTEFSEFLLELSKTSEDGEGVIFRNNHIGAFGSYDGVDNLSVLNAAAQAVHAGAGAEIFDDLGDPVNGNTNAGVDPMFTALTLGTDYDLRPAAGSPLLTGATTTAAAAGASAFIDDAGFRGAIAGDVNWAAEAGWTAISQTVNMPSGGSGLVLGPNDVDVIAGLSTDANGNKVVDTDLNWTADKTYILTDKVFVTEGATLTIEPGTKIYSSLDDGGTSADSTDDFFGALIVTRGSMIDANGTSAAPIIFDSIDNLEALRGSDVDGDGNTATALGRQDAAKWGGVIILGNATVSRYDASGLVGEGQIEGFSTATNATNDLDNDGRVDLVEYGGGTSPVDNDDSGIFRYVSIRHGGRTFVTGSEINGLTLGGVGSDTEIDHVEVFANSDDGIEFFGGTVSTSHMVMAYNFDDGFDFDEGQSGEHQYWLVIQDHAPGATGADNGGEWDGTGGTKAVTNILSTPKLFNLTFVGPGTNGGTALGNDKGNNAMLMDDFFNGQIYNSVFTEFSEFLLELSKTSEDGEGVIFRNNHIGAFGSYDGVDNLSVLNAAAQAVHAGAGAEIFDDLGDPVNGNTNAGVDPMFTALTLGTDYDLRPAAGSPLLTGATTTAAAAGASAFIDDAGFRGAIAGDVNWAAEAGWTAISQTVNMPSGLPSIEIPVSQVFLSGEEFSITFASEAGKTYKITASPDLSTPFTEVAGQTGIAGTGSDLQVMFTIPNNLALGYFFRVEEE